MMRRTRKSSHFPYTTLFRSKDVRRLGDNGKDGQPSGVCHRVLRGCAQFIELVRSQAIETGISCQKKLFLRDRKSTRLNSSHPSISYAVFCLTEQIIRPRRTL